MSSSESDGEFQRSETVFRETIRDEPDAEFQPEADRYHVYISRACPWAHGVALVRTLLGLEDTISMDIVDPYREQEGWQFTPEKAGCTPDTVTDADYLSEVYRAADPTFDGRVSVPVLWDEKRGTIVNNESVEIMKMLADAFGDYQDRDVDLYPSALRDDVDRVIDEIYDPINNGVYKTGFARSQEAYDRAVDDLFDALDHWNSILGGQRYLVGDRLTLADIRLFPTLVRFDHVYHTHFKCNKKQIVDYPTLWGHTKEIYQLPGVSETVNMDHITEHYYTTHTEINPTQIIARGPDLDFTEPHDRDRLAGNPPEELY